MSATASRRGPQSLLRRFLRTEAAGGVLLILAAAVALIVANSPLAPHYVAARDAHIGRLSALHWINDALMALFFLLVGLEIKRELVDGELASWPRRILPGAAALSGIIVPALIFAGLNRGDTSVLHGWAVPTATDIAFALAVLALLGPRVPASLKILLTAIAIIDDLGAILIIAIFYTGGLDLVALGGAAAGIALLIALNRARVARLLPYLLIGAGVWWAMLLSGVHATIAGVAVALTIPMTGGDAASPLARLETRLHGWVAYGVVPLFGFANAGVSLAGVSAATLGNPLPLGIALGLFAGKQIGIFGACAALVKLDIVDLPADATWRQLYGVSILCGIGFTMSLFIGLLAFAGDAARIDAVKIGVLGGSLLSALAGYAVLRGAARRPGGD